MLSELSESSSSSSEQKLEFEEQSEEEESELSYFFFFFLALDFFFFLTEDLSRNKTKNQSLLNNKNYMFPKETENVTQTKETKIQFAILVNKKKY